MATGDEDFETNYEDTPTIETSRGSHGDHEIITTEDMNDYDKIKPQTSTPILETTNTSFTP